VVVVIVITVIVMIVVVMIVVVMIVVVMIVVVVIVVTVIAMIVVVVVIVVVAMIAVVVPVVVIIVAVMAVIPVRTIARLVFGRLYEEHPLVARVILVAILAPVLCMAGGHVQVDRRCALGTRDLLDDHRLRVDHRRRRWAVREIHPAVYTGHNLAGDQHADIDIARMGERHGRPQCRDHQTD
jgi:hypothetical protein